MKFCVNGFEMTILLIYNVVAKISLDYQLF